MERLVLHNIIRDLNSKIVLLSGPRQVGKTTLAKSISNSQIYLNYDENEHKAIIIKKAWPKDKELLILDELHKMKDWKRFLKGIYDTRGVEQKIIVTGSARLDIARKMGDSLAGRHFSYTLNPLTLKELNDHKTGDLDSLLEFSGFPEPFLRANKTFYKRWQLSHLDLILRQDLIDLENVKNISQIELLVELLRNRIGSPCSYSSLAEDLQVSPATVKNWLTILENLYVVFKVTPYHKNVARSLTKAPKYYFYDIGRVNEAGARFENLVALALKSEIDYLRDTEGRQLNLFYLRNREEKEIDFLILEENHAVLALEAKLSETTPDSSFKSFFGPKKISCKSYIQLVAKAEQRREYDFGVKIEPAQDWLCKVKI